MRAHQRPAHWRRRGDGAAAPGSRRRRGGHRQHDAADQVPRGEEGRTGRRAGRPAARLGAPARPAARPEGKRAARASGRRFPGAPHDHHAPAGARGDGRARVGGSRSLARGAGRLVGRVDLSLRGVGHRHRDRAAGGGRRARCQRDSPRRVRAARRGAVRLPAKARRRDHRRRYVDDSRRRRRQAARRHASAVGRLRRGGELGRGRCGHRRRDSRCGAHAREDMEVVACVLQADGRRMRDGRRRVHASASRSRAPRVA